MCSVLIFTKPDNNHDDPSLDWQKFKAGDVIDIHADEFMHWGDDIQGPRALGWWKVVTLPGVSESDVAHLLASDVLPLVSIMGEDRTRYPHRIRTHGLEVGRLHDTMMLDEFLATVLAKPPMANPNVIG